MQVQTPIPISVFVKVQIQPNSGKCDPYAVHHDSIPGLYVGLILALTKTVIPMNPHVVTCLHGPGAATSHNKSASDDVTRVLSTSTGDSYDNTVPVIHPGVHLLVSGILISR
jgi:hypothetical protein